MKGKYSVGIDMSKGDFKVCFVEMANDQSVKIKGSKAFLNTLKGFEGFKDWYTKRKKEVFFPYLLQQQGN